MLTEPEEQGLKSRSTQDTLDLLTTHPNTIIILQSNEAKQLVSIFENHPTHFIQGIKQPGIIELKLVPHEPADPIIQVKMSTQIKMLSWGNCPCGAQISVTFPWPRSAICPDCQQSLQFNYPKDTPNAT